jgi:hypothetical protein
MKRTHLAFVTVRVLWIVWDGGVAVAVFPASDAVVLEASVGRASAWLCGGLGTERGERLLR